MVAVGICRDMQALSAYFEIQNITRLFSLPGAAPSHQVVQRDVLSVS